MQKTLKNQQGREFLLLDLPSFNYIEPNTEFIESQHSSFIRLWEDKKSFFIRIQGNYQILCLSKDATEEQAKQIIDDDFFDGYHDYQNNNKKGLCDTAKESLTSLLTSLGFKQDDNILILEKI